MPKRERHGGRKPHVKWVRIRCRACGDDSRTRAACPYCLGAGTAVIPRRYLQPTDVEVPTSDPHNA